MLRYLGGVRLAGLVACFAMLLRLTPAETTIAAPSYSVEAGRGSTHEVAAIQSRLANAGYAPIWLRQIDGGNTAVCVGKLSSKVDAYVIRHNLAAHGFNPTVTALAGTEGADIESVKPVCPDASFLTSPNAPYAVSVAFNPQSRSDTAEIVAAMKAGDIDSPTTKGLALLEGLPDSDPAKGWLLKESSRAYVRLHGKAKPVIANLVRVAKGEVASDASTRLEAKFLATDAWHYYYTNPIRAYSAYREIESELSPQAPGYARAQVEALACLLELARREKADFADVRKAADELRSSVPAKFARAHAAADLIYGESLLYEGKKAEALVALQRFEERHPGRTREISQANLNQGLLHAELREWPKAKEFLERNLLLDYSNPEENFYWQGKRWDMKKRSAEYLFFYAQQAGDEETFKKYKAYVADREYQKGAPDLRRFDVAFPHVLYERSFE